MLRSIDSLCRRVSLACAVLASLPVVAGTIDAERLKLIPARMQEYVDDGSISGAVHLVAYRGKVVELGRRRIQRYREPQAHARRYDCADHVADQVVHRRRRHDAGR